MKVLYKPGKQNVVADAVSTRPDFASANQDKGPSESAGLHEHERWERAYKSCEDCAAMVSKCQEACVPKRGDESVAIPAGGKEFEWQEGYLWVKAKTAPRAAVPGTGLRREVCLHFHGHALAGHPGAERTVQAVPQLFWWPRDTSDVEQFVRSWVACTKGKAYH